MQKNVLSIDVGGSKLLVGIIDKQGNVLASRKSLFHEPNKDSVYKAIVTESRALLQAGFEIECAGVSIPGLANPQTGMWLYACFSKISNFPLAALLSEEFQCPVYIENDANICAYGEKMFGHAKNKEDFIWVTVSNGVGAGVFLGNKIFYGASGNAGEIGHINVVDQGHKCPCGNDGCLEAYAAGPAIARRYRERVPDAPFDITAKDISEKAKLGDPIAMEIFKETGCYLGKAIASVINILNVPLVVLGGGVTMVYELFEASMMDTIHDLVYRKANRLLEVKRTALGYEASLIGAAAYALYRSGYQPCPDT
ncbi:ROK family protein [Oscillospiraceae bacterium PP1C4]